MKKATMYREQLSILHTFVLSELSSKDSSHY